MSHSVVVVVIRDAENAEDAEAQLDALLEPFDENASVDPYPEWCDDGDIKRTVDFYKDNPTYCDGTAGPSIPYSEDLEKNGGEGWNEWLRQAIGGYNADDIERGVFENGVFGYLTTYNPKSRWDWWQLGGRWHGFFQVKRGVLVGAEQEPQWRAAIKAAYPGGESERGEDDRALDLPPSSAACGAILGLAGTMGDDKDPALEGRADLLRKRDIDFESAHTLAVAEAHITYDTFEMVTNGLEIAPRFEEVMKLSLVEQGIDPEITWPDWKPGEDIEVRRETWHALGNAARKQYHEHPWIKALQEADLISWFGSDPHDEFCVFDGGRERYVERCQNAAMRPFALLLDGEWLEKGRMGWFGSVGDEKDPDLWAREYWRRIDALPDDCWLAAVDVHI